MNERRRTIHSPGRKPMRIPDNLLSIYDEMTTTEMARHFNVSRTTINKWLRIKRKEQEEQKYINEKLN